MKIVSLKMLVLSLLLLAVFGIVYAQEPEVITADNVHRLQSVARIDFADVDEAFQAGWFALSDDGSQIIAATGTDLYRWTLSDDDEISAPQVIAMCHGRRSIDWIAWL